MILNLKEKRMKFMLSALCLFCTVCEFVVAQSTVDELKNREDSSNADSTFERHSRSVSDHPYAYYPNLRSTHRTFQNNYINDESTNRKHASTGVYKTYGRGKAHISRQGETVIVPNESVQRKAYKILNGDEDEGKMSGYKGRCRECPADQTVVAAKGNSYVILPEPCPMNPKMWNHNSGPKPGFKLQEGTHVIRGTIGPKKKFCEYQYQVLVRRCEPLKPHDKELIIECSAQDAWGSRCTVSCPSHKKAIGSVNLNCEDNLTWSSSLPKCKSPTDCSTPKVKSNSKIKCQTANLTHVEGDFIPNGSSCRFKKNGKEVLIYCKEGTWKISRKSTLEKKKNDNITEIKENSCQPNPCQNGGTCLRSWTNSMKPICMCRPQTQGAFCELRECDYNICFNEGVCIYQNGERTCYCLPEYNGIHCQYNKNY